MDASHGRIEPDVCFSKFMSAQKSFLPWLLGQGRVTPMNKAFPLSEYSKVMQLHALQFPSRAGPSLLRAAVEVRDLENRGSVKLTYGQETK